MPVTPAYFDYVLDQFSEVPGVRFKKMFGGIGFFREDLMFAMISASDQSFLKVDDTNRTDFEAKGMEPFDHPKRGRGMPYWEIPPDVLEDKTELAAWAEKSFQIAVKAKKK